MKICQHCRRRRRLSSFYRNASRPDGWSKWCSDCERTYGRERRARPGMAARLAKLQRSHDRREYSRIWHRQHPPENPPTAYADFPVENRHKVKARRAVNNAVRDGRLAKPEKCRCLNVEWMCDECHGKTRRIYA